MKHNHIFYYQMDTLRFLVQAFDSQFNLKAIFNTARAPGRPDRFFQNSIEYTS